MHVSITNQSDRKVVSTMCVDRETHSCIVLQADLDHLDQLVSMAGSLHVSEVRIIVTPFSDAVGFLEEMGWEPIPNAIVMRKATNMPGKKRKTNESIPGSM